MKNRKEIKKITVLPKTTETFARSYHSGSRLVLSYTIDVPEDVRHMVRDKQTKTGTYKQGLDQVVIHNDSSCLAYVTFFEFEE